MSLFLSVSSSPPLPFASSFVSRATLPKIDECDKCSLMINISKDRGTVAGLLSGFFVIESTADSSNEGNGTDRTDGDGTPQNDAKIGKQSIPLLPLLNSPTYAITLPHPSSTDTSPCEVTVAIEMDDELHNYVMGGILIVPEKIAVVNLPDLFKQEENAEEGDEPSSVSKYTLGMGDGEDKGEIEMITCKEVTELDQKGDDENSAKGEDNEEKKILRWMCEFWA